MLAEVLKRARSDERGVVAVLFAVCIVPIVMLVGAAVDYSRLANAHAAAQSAADAAALSAAASPIETEISMRLVANNFADTNLRGTNAQGAKIVEFAYNPGKREVLLDVGGSLPTYFMSIAGIRDMNYRATARAIRGLNGSTELVLVLDNTWSMAGTKLADLKSAAEELVLALKQDPKADVRIGVVPYADYVNVGTGNRHQSWVSVPADYSTTSPRTCTTRTTRDQCTRGARRTCTRTVDGSVESYDCTPQTCTTVTVPPYETCSGGGTTHYRWYGCVGSRRTGNLRLNDSQPSSPYPGYLATSQNCLNPIIPLTASIQTVTSAIRGMIVNVGGYKPSTYIPAGLIWGVNVLSPTAPFSDGQAYDPRNRRPRKVMVLMTDGENTLRFNASDGRHVAPNGSAQGQTSQLAQTYKDMDDICTHAKSQGIEVFTVSFAITAATARNAMLKCASSPAHNFDAMDRASLSAAFKNIALSLQNVRITQ
jgi:hypothetical protein